MRVVIDGWDITDYIAFGGVKWQREDVDGPNAGRALDGTLVRDRVAIKERLDITCRPLKTKELSIVMSLVYPEWVKVIYLSPIAGTEVTRTMYSNNIPATFLMRKPDGTEWWSGVTFPLIMQ